MRFAHKEESMKIDRLIFAFFLGALVWACSDSKVAGTATDTENTVAGLVRLSDGSSADGVVVRQVAVSRVASSTTYLETRTDLQGAFVFDSTIADTVNMEFRYHVKDSVLSQAQILRNVSAKEANALDVQLKSVATLRGSLESIGAASGLAGSHFIVALDSTTFMTDVFVPDSFELSIPEGDYLLTVLPADSGVVSKLRASGYTDSTIVRQIAVSLSAGEILDVGNLRWNALKENQAKPKILQGSVRWQDKAATGVSVHVVTALYGLGVADSSAFVTQAVTDSNGIWRVEAPVPDSVEGRFRVEFRGKDLLGNHITGVTPYIEKTKLEERADTILVDAVLLSAESSLRGSVFLVVDMPQSSRQDTLCWAYSIRIGILGTSNFKTVSSCNKVELLHLPSGIQDFVFYSGDELVIRNLRTGEFKREDYVKSVEGVVLPEGAVLDHQNFTYTPPMLEMNALNGGK